MDLNPHKGKIAAAGIVGLVCLAFLLGAVVSRDVGRVNQPLGSSAIETDAPPSPQELMNECDRLAAAPTDPSRTAAPVADEALAPAAAISACEIAVSANPEEPRAKFQLARALWVSRRDTEAFAHLRDARLMGYAVASLYLGDAYRDGRLPPDQTANIHTAIALYEEASDNGINDATTALEDARRELARNTFDISLFQNGDYMRRLHENDFENVQYPLSLIHYMQGLAQGFDDHAVLFIDQECRSLVSQVGIDILQAAEGPVLWASILGSTNESGDWSPQGFITALASSQTRQYVIDQGKRDASVLYNEDGRYGCSSEVTKTVLGNMMVIARNTSAQ
jgi:hypothetical protein